MIIIRLKGGLGNQLFEYSLGRRLSLERKTKLFLDPTWFSSFYPPRRYSLGNLHISAELLPSDRLNNISIHLLQNRFLHALAKRFFLYHRRFIVVENKQGFDPNILKVRTSAYLDGYWQSEKYFLPIREVLYEDLNLKKPPDKENKKTSERIQATNSISIHIRRGDYVNDPATKDLHGTCSLEYYQNGIQLMSESIIRPEFFVFSDDIQWAKNNLHIPFPTTFVSQKSEELDFLDFWLLRQCKYHIIANSSFSWWGAWISNFPEKKVICPKRWFGEPRPEPEGLIPLDWIRL